MKPTFRCLTTSLLIFGGACGDNDDPKDQTPTTVTYWQDVAPIFFDRCVACHQEGGIGPFALDNFEDAKTWATVAAAATAERRMPPWLVRDDGTCGVFEHSRALTDDEIQTIGTWAQSGTLEGEPRTDLTTPELPSLADAMEFSTPNFSPEPAGGQFAEFDEYRCFLINPQLQQDRFLTGYDVVPGNASLVHHVLVMTVNPSAFSAIPGRTNGQVMQALDDASPDRDGWPCFGLAGDGVDIVGVPITWAPGQGIVEFPPDIGYRIKAGDLLVTQIHYNMSRPELLGQSDRSTVHIRMQDQVEREGFFDLPDGFLDTLFDTPTASLAPGEAAIEFTWERDVDDYLQGVLPQMELYGVFPHMHERGRKLRVELVDEDGTQNCAADVPSWDFGWQIYYFYQEPLHLLPGQKLRVTCEFDTRGTDEPVLPGWGTQNEMCLAGLFVVP